MLGSRIREALREIGVLLIAFAPLDVALNKSNLRDAAGVLVGFLVAGVVLLVTALVLEWKD